MIESKLSLKKGLEVQVKPKIFPVKRARFVGKDCGNFLHFLGKSGDSIYGLFLKENDCIVKDNKLIYNGVVTTINVRRVSIASSFGQKINNKYLEN